MLEDYLVAQGRPWERYAWIKARPLTGGRHDELNAIVHPFVFRKYLDFGAFAAIRDLHVQIRREVARREMAHNVKLGPGGIREIEFTAQVFQLIRGGQIAALQQRPTLKVLGELVKSGLMTADAQQELPPPTISCAAWNTGSSTSTTRRPSCCRTTPSRRRCSPRRWALPTTRPCSPRSTSTATRSRGISSRCSPRRRPTSRATR
jgi:hypothetical protein